MTDTGRPGLAPDAARPGERAGQYGTTGSQQAETFTLPPSAARLTQSLRDIGYDFPSAVADLADNSVGAGATRITLGFSAGPVPAVTLADNGSGMTAAQLGEALRFGTRRPYGHPGDLGRYGLGLKTASLSQCRNLTVVTRAADGPVLARVLDLDRIARCDEWTVTSPGPGDQDAAAAAAGLEDGGGTGTVVIWRNLDRALGGRQDDPGYAARRLRTLASRTAAHLGAVFHRHIESGLLAVTADGAPVTAWNPFAPGEDTQELPPARFDISDGNLRGTVTLRRYILPPRAAFSSPAAHAAAAGPRGWNRQQGLYVYRGGRLVASGGWHGLRIADEHTKLARAAVEFGPGLDEAFSVNVAKMKVAIPPQVRKLLTRSLDDLAAAAAARYRGAARTAHADGDGPGPAEQNAGRPGTSRGETVTGAGLALRAAAMQAGEYDALTRILGVLAETDPGIAAALGAGKPAGNAAAAPEARHPGATERENPGPEL